MRRRLISAIGLATAAVALGTTGGPADAGVTVASRDVTILVNVGGSQEASIASYTPSFTPAGSGSLVGDCTAAPVTDSGFFSQIEYTCTLMTDDTYTVSIPAPPSPFIVDTRCSDAGGALAAGDQLVVPAAVGEEIGCIIGVVAPTVVLEKRVVGDPPGPLTQDDFVLEVYPAGGGSPVATASDPGVDECTTTGDIGVECGFVEVPLGDYVIGEQREYGYFPALVQCQSEPFGDGGGDGGPIIITPLEIIDDPNGEFTLSMESPFAFCAVLNAYVEGEINITKTVTNDDGGTATPDDWTIELYDDTMTLVTSVPCNADGTCLSGSFPIGEYTVGEDGPDGYTSSVSVTLTEVEPSEIIDDPNAVFELPPFGTADVVVASDDQPTTTTTSTTSTTVAPTTAAPTTATPTTLVTTTAFDAGAGTLPATGGDDGRTRNVALLAFVLLGVGVAATRLARR